MQNRHGGFVAGTRLLCSNGYVPVEFIGIGEGIITRDDGVVRVTEINRMVVDTHFINFQPHSLSEISPTSELLLPHDQVVLVRNRRAREVFSRELALVEAKELVDDVFIEMTEKRKEILFQISCSSPYVIYLEGVEVESTESLSKKRKVLQPAE